MANARDTVYGELRRRLMSGAFLPGQRLREEHIATEMSVSRTPVRAAIQQLVADGLIKLEERRGAVVVGWTDRDINEAFEMRSLLESYAAGIAALNATPAQIEQLEALNDAMRAAIHSQRDDRIEQVQQLNNQFHHLLVDAAHSAQVRTLLGNFLDMPIIIGSFYFYSDDDMLTSVAHHSHIIAAVRSRNRPLAETAMRLHLGATHTLFINQRAEKQ